MLLGFGAFAELPFSYSGTEGNVTIVATKNQLTLTIGPVGQEVTSVIEQAGPDALVLGTGEVTISANVNIDSGLKNPLILATGDVTVSGNAVVDSGLKNELIISSGTVTITGNANVSIDGVPLILDSKESGVITWNEIIPGATMVWTPIVPY
tara:strand:+ start:98 stop:553 length:456 start_codon:yes stop_codon:yes gene_type:complete